MVLDISESRVRWFAIGVILVIAAIAFFYLIFKKPEKIVPTVAVAQGTMVDRAEAVGNIKTQDFSTIKSQVDGIVEEIYHEEGEYVTKGTSLLKIKPAPRPVEYAEAYKDLLNDKTAERHAKTNFSKQQHLLKTGIIASNNDDYISARKEYDSAKNQRILSEQKLALLTRGETVVGGKSIASVVVSPIDGYILYRNINVGDPVISISSSQAATPLSVIANMNNLVFQGVVDERDAAKINVGQKAKIKIAYLPDSEIIGVVSRIALQSEKESLKLMGSSLSSDNSNSSPFEVGFRIEIANLQLPKNLVLRSGYSATADVEIKKVDDVLILPMRVIHFKEDKPIVYFPAKKGEKPEERSVELGVSDHINVEIKKGLKLGDQVLDNQVIDITARDN